MYGGMHSTIKKISIILVHLLHLDEEKFVSMLHLIMRMNVDHCLYGSFCVFAGKPFPILLGSTPSLGITAGSDGIVRLSSTYSHFCRHKCLGNITGRFTAFESLNHPGYFLSHHWFILKLQYATERFVLCPYCHAISYAFLHNRPWKSAWMKSISNELDITIHVITSQLCRYCDVISNQL